MCYNVAYLERRQQKYFERYSHVLEPEVSTTPAQLELPLYFFVSGFSHPLLPIVKRDGIFLYEWGLIPAWTKDLNGANEIRTRTLNAVGETVFEKASFRKCIASQRCLLGISGFFEWRDFNKKKYPYFIRLKSNEIFSLGCIYDTWVDKGTGEIRNTFSILTTAANPMMENIHNLKKRMPLIISYHDEIKWMQPALKKEEINALIRPYDENDMLAYTISQVANNARSDRNNSKILEPVEYAELPDLNS